MTVQNLIDELMTIVDKTKKLEIDDYYIVSTVIERKTTVSIY